MKKILAVLNSLHGWLVAAAVIGSIGYSSYLAYLVATARPDAAYMETKKEAARASVVKIDPKPIEAAAKLEAIDGSTGITAGHQPDPFSP